MVEGPLRIGPGPVTVTASHKVTTVQGQSQITLVVYSPPYVARQTRRRLPSYIEAPVLSRVRSKNVVFIGTLVQRVRRSASRDNTVDRLDPELEMNEMLSQPVGKQVAFVTFVLLCLQIR